MNNNIYKILSQIFILLTLISTIMLRITSVSNLESQSAYFGELNDLWYKSIHFGIIMSFIILNGISNNKQFLYGAVAFASTFTLMFDVYEHNIIHYFTTGSIFILSSLCIIIYEEKLKIFYTILCLFLGIIFLFSFLNVINIKIHLIEDIIEWTFGIIIIIRIKNQKMQFKLQKNNYDLVYK